MKISWNNFPFRVLTRKRYHQMKQALEAKDYLRRDMNFLKGLPEEMAGFFLQDLEGSAAQLRQDLFILWETRRKKGGFFVEVGACDGLLYSNTVLLEKKYQWEGLVVEPGRQWHASLKKNRKCRISDAFVSRKSGETVRFFETEEGEFSTAEKHALSDSHADKRQAGAIYEVQTTSLGDLLQKYSMPQCIDYLSLDTEGSELEILQGLDFEKHDIRCITCEHNFSPRRDQIYRLLTGYGYVRKYEKFSSFDDWFFKLE